MELIERCKAGEHSAWREFVTEHAARVYRWCVLLGLSPADAEETSQEVFSTAARRVDLCFSDRAINSWLYQIARRLVANRRRLAWWRRRDAVPTEERAFAASPASVEMELSVRACLRRLPQAQAEVLVLMDVEGYTRQEVSEMLSVAEGTIASRLRLAREAFKTHWQRVSTSSRALTGEASHG